MSGRLYRRCACRSDSGRQLNGNCPKLAADSRHGTWTFALERPSVNGRRATLRRSGFASKREAKAELDKAVQRQQGGVTSDDRETLGEFLEAWLTERQRTMKPTGYARYRDYCRKDIIPSLGHLSLEKITHGHVAGLVTDMERSGRGAVTIRRCHATLRSALTDAVKRRRLLHNPASYTVLPDEVKTEKGGWTIADAIGFLAHVHDAGDRDADLFELLIGTGLRKGEALALRWSDVDVTARIAHVRQTLSSVDNSRLEFTTPKTKGSAAGVGLSKRVIEALNRQRERQDAERAAAGAAYDDHGLVFARPDGKPLRPEYVLRKFRRVTEAAGLPIVRVHDLRHLAASMMIAAGVPLPIVSKTLRHSTVSITSDVYSHLTADVAREAVDAMAAMLAAAEAEAQATARAREALGAHTHGAEVGAGSGPHTQRAHTEAVIMD